MTQKNSTQYIDILAKYECPGITARKARTDLEREEETNNIEDPIVFKSASGMTILDVDNKQYLDMGACFAVAAYGHANKELIDALYTQASKMMHAMGDLYPSDVKIDFLKALADISPGNLQQSILGLSGADAIEAAMKTAQLATKKKNFIAFENSYHGLSFGALSLTAHRDSFKRPFSSLNNKTTYFPFPNCLRCPYKSSPEKCGFLCLECIRQKFKNPASGLNDIAAIVVEPIQGRAGIIVPPQNWLTTLRDIAKEFDVLLILDEIFTGFGRTAKLFACQHEDICPDILCLGKALSGSFPISAAIASTQLMQKAWKLNTSEAIHTTTFLANPMGCALGLKALEILQRDKLTENAQKMGALLFQKLIELQQKYPSRIAQVRGKGLMIGIEFVTDSKSLEPDTETASMIVSYLRKNGVILLQSGAFGQIISITPPLIIKQEQILTFYDKLESACAKLL